jgi:hypothetical protein
MLLLLVLCALVIMPALSQSHLDYVKSTSGDTLVIKAIEDGATNVNALTIVMKGDSVSPPAGRVYMLQAGKTYMHQNNPSTRTGMVTRIIGSDFTPLVKNSKGASSPPLIVGNVGTSSTNNGGLGGGGDIIVKNCALAPTAADGSMGWLYIGTGAVNQRFEFDNCLFEHTRWAEVGAFNNNCTFILKNCYFVNLSGQPCRRNGGVYDGFNNLDTFLVENCTHVMTQGSMYKWRANTANRIAINHNTFINCAGIQFMDLGKQKNISYTNNIFVNCNIQGYPRITSIDDGEQDPDFYPMGLVTVTVGDSAMVANSTPRKFLWENNLVYWDPFLNNMVDTLNTINRNGKNTWQSQAIVMNVRVDSIFKHLGRWNTTPYSYCIKGKQYSEKVNFTDSKDLFGVQLSNLKKFAVATVDTGGTAVLADCRLLSIGASNFIYNDWPIPVNLAYSNSTLLTAGYSGLPLGDLNWFPTQKATWLAGRTAEYTAIQNALDTKTPLTSVRQVSNAPVDFALEQNYPNPFNPTTNINFSLSRASNVSLKVFDIIGREVATLVNEYKAAGSYNITFDATNYASGVYFYQLTSGDFSSIKKMTLVK